MRFLFFIYQVHAIDLSSFDFYLFNSGVDVWLAFHSCLSASAVPFVDLNLKLELKVKFISNLDICM